MLRVFFLISLFVLGFAYGTASLIWKLWPYELIRDAYQAGFAFKRLQELRARPKTIVDEAGTLPPGTAGGIFQHPAGQAGDEWLLVAGGPHQHRDRCPRFGCVAWIMDRQGRIQHAWEPDPNALWPGYRPDGKPERTTAFHPTGLHLFDNGDLLVIYSNDEIYPSAFGLARIDRKGNPIWARLNRAHHWPTFEAGSGLIFVPEMELVSTPLPIGDTGEFLGACLAGHSREDWVRVLNASGGLMWELSLLDALDSSGLHGLLAMGSEGCDPLHLNYISPLTSAAAARMPGTKPGDLLVSMRNLNTLAVIGRRDGMVRKVFTGMFLAQHSPEFLSDGRLLVLDNRGGTAGQGGTRVVMFDPRDGSLETVFPRPGATGGFLPVRTEYLGHLQLSSDEERVLFTESRHGRILEFELATGKVLWAYANDHPWKQAGEETPATPTRFHNVAAYYVEPPSFLGAQDSP